MSRERLLNIKTILAPLVCLALISCEAADIAEEDTAEEDEAKAVSLCADQNTRLTLYQAFTNRAVDDVRRLNFGIPEAEIQDAVRGVTFEIRGERTTYKSEVSSESGCEGLLQVSFPEAIWENASAAWTEYNFDDPSLGSFITNWGGRTLTGPQFEYTLAYTTQLSDDRSMHYVQSEDTNLPTIVSNILAQGLVFEREKAKERSAELARMDALNAERQEALETRTLFEERINAVWRGAPAEFREEFLELQRAWIVRKEASCKEGVSQVENRIEADRDQYLCEARLTLERTQWLERRLEEFKAKNALPPLY